jgi:hypothetical protein
MKDLMKLLNEEASALPATRQELVDDLLIEIGDKMVSVGDKYLEGYSGDATPEQMVDLDKLYRQVAEGIADIIMQNRKPTE